MHGECEVDGEAEGAALWLVSRRFDRVVLSELKEGDELVVVST